MKDVIKIGRDFFKTIMIKKLKNRDEIQDEIQKDLDIMYVQKVKEIKKLKLDSKSEIAVIEIMFWAMVETGTIYIHYIPTFTPM